MQRLKTRPQFQAAMAGGIVSRTPHFALHRLVLDVDVPQTPPSGPGGLPSVQAPQALFGVVSAESGSWLGAMAPKRWAKRSVTRHAIQRQVYVLGDEYAPQLARAAYVVRLRATFDRKQFISATSEPLKQAIRAELQQLFAYAVRRQCAPAAARPAAATGAMATVAAKAAAEKAAP
ncbi:ribonuclease P protein component [Pantoea sp. 18069]|uniref:ribonuclease P protein component n=1 Tax=Pantoea sp. 18069 TaxID=2681415 RepID=UPI0013585BBC|nr:ribonuclease P protein component [Pantoea sp. 18069]